MSKQKVILISREYGSGGREIGEKLAKALKIPFYDRELILRACEESGFDASIFENAESQSQHPFSYFLSMFSTSVSPHDLSLNDQIFLIQGKVIRDVAKDSCVIIGRCADYILRDYPNVIKVFIHAPLEDRIRRVKEEYHDDAEDIKTKISHIDKNRATYYNYYTNKKWGKIDNYDLTINSSKLGIERCVSLLQDLIEEA